jgi:hypothetical protein
MSQARNRKAWRLVGRQHGMVARGQLLALGFSAAAIQHRLAYGRLHPVARGIYAVGWPYLDQRRRWSAAVLAAAAGDKAAHFPTRPYLGHRTALSHRSAAALWGIGTERRGRVDLSVLRAQAVRRPGLHVHRRPSLSASEICIFDHLPVTSPVQTLIDLATELDSAATERAVNDADKRDLIDPEALRLALDDHGGEPGVRRLRKILDRLTFRLSDSDLEIYFRPIASRPPSHPRSANSGSMASKSISSGPTSALSSRPTASAITEPCVGHECIPDVSPISRRSTVRRRRMQGGRGQADRGRREPE